MSRLIELPKERKQRVKCANCGMIYDITPNSPFRIECPGCKSNAYDRYNKTPTKTF